ncbi:hypothetical protein [Microcoleus sp. D3_18_C4]|uniref:hypothetical protein n=1 Tax=Microcoleus sp. D3_18_C4 TaxID=3055335 RepID=UPI002FCEAF8A
MSNKQELTKEQLLKLIEELKNNPSDGVGLIADAGVTALGAGGAGAAAAILGSTTASIPIFTAVTGLGMLVAAPAALVAGAAVVGGATVYGVSRFIKDGGFHEGKRKQLLNEYEEQLREVEAKERRSNFDEQDKTRFYLVLKEAVTNNLISPDDAHQLVQSLENGHISLSEVYELLEQLFSDSPITQPIKVVIACPNCSQKLRAPSNLGQLNLSCPKCKHSWSCVPK